MNTDLKTTKEFDTNEVKKRIVQSRVRLLMNHAFFGNMATRLIIKDATDWCPTAATDGKHLYYNKNFLGALPDEELDFVIAHEVMHCVYDHFDRRATRDPQYWNMAGDYKINGMLVREKIGEIIDQVKICYDEKYNDNEWYTENVYDDLYNNQAPVQATLDVHLDMEGEGDDEDGKGNTSGGDAEDGDQKGKGKKPTISKDDAKAISDEMKNAIIQAAQTAGAGNVPAEIARMISELTEPKMDWRQHVRVTLESNLSSDFTFMRPNRKSQFNSVVIPGMKKDEKIDICIALDASGSISQRDCTDFLSEVQGIMDQFGSYRIRIWSFDTAVYAYDEFTDDDGRSIEEYNIVGGGGTDFMCNWQFMEEQGIEPDQFIMFTDGFPWDSWGMPDYCDTLFLIKHPSFCAKPGPAPFGQTVYYNEEESQKQAA